jgi:beta-galactosidase
VPEEGKGISRRGFLKIASATSSTPLLFKHFQPLFAENALPQAALQHAGEPKQQIRPRVDLDGAWEFQLDPKDQGAKLGWYQSSPRFDRTLRVPGAWEAQGLGIAEDEGVGEKTYEGVAWLRRSFTLPADWQGKRIWLRVGGVHRRATFWLNGHEVGLHDGYLTPFSFDLTEKISFATENIVTARVDNIYRGLDDDQFGCFDWIYNWGGIHRGVYLEATEAVWIDDVSVIPDLAGNRARVKLRLAQESGAVPASAFRVACVVSTAASPEHKVGSGEAAPNFVQGSGTAEFEISVPIKEVRTWSPADPFLYRVEASLLQGTRKLDERWLRFGMREIKAEGRKFLLNGSPLYLLGYGDECIFPATVSPSLDREEYRRRLTTARSYGFNYVRHHTHVPVEEYLDVADELGMMVQVELTIMGSYTDDTTMGTDYRKNLLEAEWRRIILNNRNHPSIITYSMGNENYSVHPDVRTFLSRLYDIAKELDPTRLVLNEAGSTPSQDRFGQTDFIERSFNEGWESPEGAIRENLTKRSKDLTRPVIVHEMGYFGGFPDPALTSKYESIKALPAYYAGQLLSKANAAMKNQLILDPYFGKHLPYTETLSLWAAHSAKMQAANMKLAFEETRTVPTVNGYFLWSLNDTSTLVHGLLDDFWQPKLISAQAFRKFNAESVVLLGGNQRIAWMGDEVDISLLISHFQNQPIKSGHLEWTFALEGKPLVAGSIENLQASVGDVSKLASFRATMPKLPRASTLTLTVTVKSQLPDISNEWKFWVFPKDLLATTGQKIAIQPQLTPIIRKYPFPTEAADDLSTKTPRLFITSSLPPAALTYLENGGRVFLLSEGLFEELDTEFRACYINFAGNNAGTVIRRNPALDAFPHEGFCDLQFYRLLKIRRGDVLRNAKTIVLEDFPVTIDPIIRSVDRYQYMRDKAYLFEISVGRGKLLISTLSFFSTPNVSSNSQPGTPMGLEKADFSGPECLFMFDQLVRYALSEEFRPTARISSAVLAKLMEPNTRHQRPDDLLDCSYCAPEN